MTDDEVPTEFAVRKGDILLDVRQRSGGLWTIEVKIDATCAPDETLDELIDVANRARRVVCRSLGIPWRR